MIWYNKWFKAFQDNKRIFGAFWNEKYQSIKSKKNYKYWEIMWRKFLFEINWVFIKKISKLVVTNKTSCYYHGRKMNKKLCSFKYFYWMWEMARRRNFERKNIVARIISIKHVFLKKKIISLPPSLVIKWLV